MANKTIDEVNAYLAALIKEHTTEEDDGQLVLNSDLVLINLINWLKQYDSKTKDNS